MEGGPRYTLLVLLTLLTLLTVMTTRAPTVLKTEFILV